MNVSGGGGSLFELEGSVTLDTSKLESSVHSAVSSAHELEDAFEFDSASVSITTNASSVKEDISEIDTAITAIDNSSAEADINADTTDADSSISDVDSGLSELDSEDAEPEISADASAADSEISTIDSDLDTLDSTSVEPTITADTEDASAGIQGVQEDIEGIGTAAGEADTAANSFFDNLATYATGGAVIAALSWVKNQFSAIVNSAIDAGSRIQEESQRLEMTYSEYQEWDYIMSQVGGSVNDLYGSYRNLTSELGKAEGPSEEFAAGLEAIGLSVEDLQGLTKGEVFSKIIAGVQDYGAALDATGDPAADTKQYAVAQALLGNRFRQILPLINATSDEITDLKTEASDLGLIMSDEDVEAADDFGDTLEKFQRTVQGIANNLVDEVLGPLTTILNKVTDFIGTITDPSLTSSMQTISEDYIKMMTDISSQEMEANAIIEAMAELTEFEGLTEEQEAAWDAYAAKLEEIMPGVTNLFGEQAGEINGGVEALRTYNEEFFEALKLQALQETISKRQTALAEAAGELADARIEQKVLENKVAEYEKNQADNFATIADAYGLNQERTEELLAEFTDGEGAIDYAGAAKAIVENVSQGTTAGGARGLAYAGYMGGFYSGSEKSEFTAPEGKAAEDAAIAYEALTSGMEEATTEAELHRKKIAELEEEYTQQQEDFEEYVEVVDDVLSGMTDSAGDASDAIDESTDDMNTSTTKATTFVTKMVDNINKQLDRIKSVTFEITGKTNVPDAKPHATGLREVPYDNYLASLHKGERVLTRLEAQRYGDENYGSEVDYDRMANTIASAVAQRPIAFSVSGKDLATATRDDASRAAAFRYAQVSTGYGRGA